MQTGRKDISGGRFLGHSANADGAGVPELLHDHLRRVAEYAARFSAAFNAQDQGHAMGLLHDLGKYADQFQRRLRNSSEPSRDHWTMGALALSSFGKGGLLAACAAAAHHTGLSQLPQDAKSY